MSTRLYSLPLHHEDDVVQARQIAREIGTLLNFDPQDQVRIATATSELARNAFRYAGGGEVYFDLAPGLGHLDQPQSLVVEVVDQGPGIEDLQRILRGRYVLNTGLGMGLIGTRRLMDEFDIESTPGKGTRVRVSKRLSARRLFKEAEVRAVLDKLKSEKPKNLLNELEEQNRELMAAMEQLRQKNAELDHLNHELDDTNRGVVALYAELDERAGFLQRTSELKTRFLSNMSHEFRTPLNSIISLSQLLLDRVDGDLGSEQEKQVTYIRRSADTLLELVNDLLDLAKIEAGKVTVYPNEFRVNALFGALRGMLRPLLTNPEVSLTFEDAPEIGVLWTDESKVSQILRNFISNALKFTQGGEVAVTARLGQHDTVIFSVRDSGIGIAKSDQVRVFEEFTQIENALQRRNKGTGLGLPLTKKFAELLGGSVSLESETGKGSVFSAIIPRVYSDSMEKLHESGTAAASALREASPLVLIIDDEEISRYVLRNLLRASNFRVMEATGGESGLQLAESRRPAAIFLDLIMPGMLGEETLQQLKANPTTAPIPVIIHTSKALDDDERERLLMNAVAIISKESSSRDDSLRAIYDAMAKAGLDMIAGRREV
ncbi:histidine kinase [Candidatus Koribacter versatilis Ellin345]|uniref:histidine kinase n=1 Tax=Koribacter versatilis (strain Ellin345) TaxID=204669 RepID=Q1INY7_KORVE|nr:ATP-binding protein [Candidatus Koribacter versatilis]ABF41413.1 histidine kinase [Candidatus Koribacter versatilis Ellin345]